MTKLRADRRELDTQIRALKSVLRTRWVRPMAPEQRALHRLRHQANELCILRAWLRGRLHLRDEDRCREVAHRRMGDYQNEEAA